MKNTSASYSGNAAVVDENQEAKQLLAQMKISTSCPLGHQDNILIDQTISTTTLKETTTAKFAKKITNQRGHR